MFFFVGSKAGSFFLGNILELNRFYFPCISWHNWLRFNSLRNVDHHQISANICHEKLQRKMCHIYHFLPVSTHNSLSQVQVFPVWRWSILRSEASIEDCHDLKLERGSTWSWIRDVWRLIRCPWYLDVLSNWIITPMEVGCKSPK